MRQGFITTLTITPTLLLLASPCACSSHRRASDAPPQTPSQQASAHIEDVTWRLASAGGKSAANVSSGATAANFRLNSTDKNVSGFSGVNQFSGSYQLQGQSLRFGPLAMTRRAGPPELMQQEAALSHALMTTAAWRATSKDRIDLLDSSGKPLASFVAQGLN